MKCNHVSLIIDQVQFKVWTHSLHDIQAPAPPLLHPLHSPLWQMTPPLCKVLIQLALALIILPMTDYQRGHCLHGGLNERDHD